MITCYDVVRGTGEHAVMMRCSFMLYQSTIATAEENNDVLLIPTCYPVMFHPDFEQGSPTNFNLTSRCGILSNHSTLFRLHDMRVSQQKQGSRHEGFVMAIGSVFHAPTDCRDFCLRSPHSLSVIKNIARRLAFYGNISVNYIMPKWFYTDCR